MSRSHAAREARLFAHHAEQSNPFRDPVVSFRAGCDAQRVGQMALDRILAQRDSETRRCQEAIWAREAMETRNV